MRVHSGESYLFCSLEITPAMFKSIARNPYISLLTTAWKYAREERWRYLLVYSMFMLNNLIEACLPIAWGWFINEIQRKGVDVFKSLWFYVGAYLVLHFSGWVFHFFARIMERSMAFNLSRNFLQEMYHKVLHLTVKWHQDNHSGITINRVRKAYEALKEFFQNGFMYIHAFTKFIFSFAAMLYFSPLFGSIAILLGLIAIYIIFKFDKPLIKYQRETNEREHVVSANLFDSLSNIVTVITLRLEKRMESGLMQRVAEIFPPFRRKIMINELKWFTVDGIVAIIYCTIIVGYIYQTYVPGELLLIGGIVTLMSYVQRFTSVFHDIAWQYNQVVTQHTDVQTAQNIFDAYEKQHLPESAAPLPQRWQKIQIKQLSYIHELDGTPSEGQYRPGLHDLNIEIARGKRIALIGESGSGKSTLLALMRGLYPPKPGLQLMADGHNYDKLDVLSDYITLFPQEPEIFENTIEYNITLGLPFSKEEVMKVCETAHFLDVVEQLPSGLESNIREKGVNLSGGQKQRLALARGVLAARDSDIILLDEPTSSVDPKTELLIYERMFQDFSDKAIVSALHRLHLLVHFDYVYVMENGRVVDEGTFEYLREHSAVFQEMWKHQEQAGVL
jgi:ABC-type multidrug transport system fused ATPase/permease subunit